MSPPNIQTLNGWLSPEGKLFPCETTKHYELATELAIMLGFHDADPQRCLERLGWAKLAADEHNVAWFIHRRGSGVITFDHTELTDRQLVTVMQWHEVQQRTSPLLALIDTVYARAAETVGQKP